jgi:hypothetical protein
MSKSFNLSVITLFFILSLFSLSFPAETITITTYYPSPFGSYRELRAQRMAIGANYSGSAYCWSPEACTNQITDNNVNLIVEGNVGIGTANPTSPAPNGQPGNLDVNDIYLRSKGMWASNLLSSSSTFVSCSIAGAGGWEQCTTPSCPAGYVRSGCSFWYGGGWADSIISGAMPSGADACSCQLWSSAAGAPLTCYTYCIK